MELLQKEHAELCEKRQSMVSRLNELYAEIENIKKNGIIPADQELSALEKKMRNNYSKK